MIDFIFNFFIHFIERVERGRNGDRKGGRKGGKKGGREDERGLFLYLFMHSLVD